MGSDLEQAMAAERRLHDPAVRASAVELDRLLDAEFTEIGASGRLWSRSDVVADLAGSARLDDLEVVEMSARHVADDVILVTYTTSTPDLTARRSSWWRRRGGEWRCVFHQGTPLPSR
jgi:hypothetical protein